MLNGIDFKTLIDIITLQTFILSLLLGSRTLLFKQDEELSPIITIAFLIEIILAVILLISLGIILFLVI